MEVEDIEKSSCDDDTFNNCHPQVDHDVVIDTSLDPSVSVTRVYTAMEDGLYGVGEDILVTVVFSAPVSICLSLFATSAAARGRFGVVFNAARTPGTEAVDSALIYVVFHATSTYLPGAHTFLESILFLKRLGSLQVCVLCTTCVSACSQISYGDNGTSINMDRGSCIM